MHHATFFSVVRKIRNRVKSGNLGKIVRFAIRVKPGIVLIEFMLSGDPLYFHRNLLKDKIESKI